MKKIAYYHKNSNVLAYTRVENSNVSWEEYTYDERGNRLTYKNSDRYWYERTYDEKGNQLTYKTSGGYYQINGKSVSKEEFDNFLNPKPCLGKKVVVDGVEYILS